jgi:hypothetical protein
MVVVTLMFLSEWLEFPAPFALQEELDHSCRLDVVEIARVD